MQFFYSCCVVIFLLLFSGPQPCSKRKCLQDLVTTEFPRRKTREKKGDSRHLVFMFWSFISSFHHFYLFLRYTFQYWLALLVQAIVGDKTIAFLLMDTEMYSGMSSLTDASPTVERGLALHKVCSFQVCGDCFLLLWYL
jgi:hypothetical protein